MIIIPTTSSYQRELHTEATILYSQWMCTAMKSIAYDEASYAYILDHIEGSVKLKSKVLQAYSILLAQDPLWLQARKPCWLQQGLNKLQESLRKEGLILPAAKEHLIYQKLPQQHATYHFGMHHIKASSSSLLKRYQIKPYPTQKRCTKHEHLIYKTLEQELQAALRWQAEMPSSRIVYTLDSQSYQGLYQRYQRYHYSHISIYDVLALCGEQPTISHELALILKQPLVAQYQRNAHIRLKPCITNAPIHFDQFKVIVLEQLTSFGLLEHHHPVIHDVLAQLKKIFNDLCMLQRRYERMPYSNWHQNLISLVPYFQSTPHLPTLKDLQGSFYEEIWVLGFNADALRPQAAPAWISDLPPDTLNWQVVYQNCHTLMSSSPLTNIHEQMHELPKHAEPSQITEAKITPLSLNPIISIDNQGFKTRGTISASLIGDYAQCPFKAYAKYQLKIRSLETECIQPNAAEFGNLMHQVLETLYQSIQSQDQINNITPAAIQICIKQCWQELQIKTPAPLQVALQQEIADRITKWLHIEKNRPTFNVISLEKTQILEINDTNIRMRIDRIDKINDQYLIVDYKTGYANISDALNPNFTSPQLPLYALTQHSTPQIAYALMQSDPTLQQLDLTDAQAIEKRQKTRQYNLQDIDTLKQHWLSAATQIITDYQQGFFSASPSTPLVCQTCELQSLCRKHLMSTTCNP